MSINVIPHLARNQALELIHQAGRLSQPSHYTAPDHPGTNAYAAALTRALAATAERSSNLSDYAARLGQDSLGLIDAAERSDAATGRRLEGM